MTPEFDFVASDHGKIWLVRPTNATAEAWCKARLSENSTWKGSYIVKETLVRSVLDAIEKDGFEVDDRSTIPLDDPSGEEPHRKWWVWPLLGFELFFALLVDIAKLLINMLWNVARAGWRKHILRKPDALHGKDVKTPEVGDLRCAEIVDEEDHIHHSNQKRPEE